MKKDWEPRLDEISGMAQLPELTRELNTLAGVMFAIAASKGFHAMQVPVATHCANLHGEVSELWEAYRRGTLSEQCDKATAEPLTCLEEELADVFIRVLDMAADYRIDIAKAVRVKAVYNASRSYMNGGKIA